MADSPKATERQARTPLPPQKESPFKRPRMQVLLLVLALLAANYLFVAIFAPGEPEPVRIPYSPVFLDQVRDGNVERISTQGATVDGKFKKEFTYQDSEPTKSFATEILLIALFVFLARRAGGGPMSALGNFGRSRARRSEGGEQKITFADVAGI